MLKIATWNVNSIRARLDRFIEWVKEENPDVLLLQELKCTDEQFPFFELECLNYNIATSGQKARNGVAILSKYPLYDINKRLPLYDLVEVDEDARYIEAYFDYNNKVIKVASIYVPNGGPTVLELQNQIKDYTLTESFDKKMKFYERLKLHFTNDIKNSEIAFFGADYNTCPTLFDMYSVKKDGDICCYYKEREKFQQFIDIGMSDIWRKLNPDIQEYSWWNYRMNGWAKNQGLRLDAILTTPEATKLVQNCKIYSKETRGKEKASDHVPMMCEIK